MKSSASHAVLLALPCGLSLGGVTTWAVRLANHLASRDVPVGMLLHTPRTQDRPAAFSLHPRIRQFMSTTPPMDEAPGSDCFDAEYHAAIHTMLDEARVVIGLPSLMGDSYGAMVSAARSLSDSTRILGWAHLDSPYELRVLEHYESAIHRFVGVSRHLTSALTQRLPHRTADIYRIPYGTAIPLTPPQHRRSPLYLAYVGRLDDELKRVRVLSLLSDALLARGIDHTLSIAGDGPARGVLEHAASTRPSLRMLGSLPSAELEGVYDAATFLVLPSRAEGLALVLQESMARGCIPIAVDTPSGTRDLIDPGHTGMLVQDSDSLEQLADRMADAITQALQRDLTSLSHAAHAHVAAHFNLHHTLNATLELFAACVNDPPRTWSSPVTSFTAMSSAGSGTVPADAATRMDEVLRTLAGRRILIYGTGQHSRALRPVFERHRAYIAGFLDDDPSRAGTTFLDQPVMTPTSITVDATDVVLSSWIHESSLWARRHTLEHAGLRIHRLYGESNVSTR